MIVVLSYVFVFGIIALSTLLQKMGIFKDEMSRKFIHIGVGNWIIIAYFYFDDPFWAVFPPFTFIVLNYISYRLNLFKAMERAEKTKNDLGTVYYAVSLFIVVLLDFILFDQVKLSVLPILVMAYGDGLSAIVGTRFKSIKLFGNKTLYGSMTLLIVAIIIASILGYTLSGIVIIAVVATVVEIYSPRGFDNLTVPLILYGLLLSGVVV